MNNRQDWVFSLFWYNPYTEKDNIEVVMDYDEVVNALCTITGEPMEFYDSLTYAELYVFVEQCNDKITSKFRYGGKLNEYN